MKNTLLLLFLVISVSVKAQKFNTYKYIIVTNKFDFLSKTDQYQTSSLTKFLFNKKGFTAFLSDEQLPQDFNTNRCESLFASVVKTSSMFVIKTAVQLKDCNNKVVYTSSIGRSKEKDYKKGYHEAIRRAFEDPIFLNYNYKLSKKGAIPIKDKVTTLPKKVIVTTTSTHNTVQKVLYAQKKEQGYQLVDTTPKIVFTILTTSIENLFVLKDKKGIFYKKNTNWFVEYYENNKLIKEKYQVKF
ncbi:MAG: hypothetical protein HWD85_12165 [Flavobacteriaceae bacterium]|nr:hypothetical protein [Flavobacteriaceae bacterium]